MVSNAAEDGVGVGSVARFRQGSYAFMSISISFDFVVSFVLTYCISSIYIQLSSKQPAIFEDIAQEALSFCRLSLIHASDLISASTTSPSASSSSNNRKLDGALFLVRHMLILKEVWASLEEMKVKEEGGPGSAGVGMKSPTLGMGLGSARGLDFGLGAGGVTGECFL